ncbi:hypothetical protein M0811_06770 [Anaeramoeba ignava]|uniref:TLDc domain-containing protein n=1 Tax=Anaeramoeba ignava TaxID=1746090 RepID=A0A9Q0LR08_ANAIG|nr:hypothetical protein M0811_06770 [Anaeramoeba ignava]
MNDFDIFQSIMKWGKHKSNIIQEKEKLQKQISNIIDKIRFIDFSKQELEDTLKEDLIPNEISEKLIQFQKLQNQNNEKKLNQFIEKENQNQNSFIFKSRFKSSSIIKEKEYFNKLKEWINDDEFFSKMKKGFSAKRDGFDSYEFHKKADEKGKTLVIIKTKDNFIFGGFTKVGFTGDRKKWNQHTIRHGGGIDYDSGDIVDPDAFIFTLRNDKNDRKPEKFTVKKGKENVAVHFEYSWHPQFGAGRDICLMSDLKTGFSYFGKTYNLPNGIQEGTKEAYSYLTGTTNKFVVEEIEAYFI